MDLGKIDKIDKSGTLKRVLGGLSDVSNVFSDTGSIFSAGALEIEGNNKCYKILESEYEIRQQIKDNGEPAGGVGAGLIKVTIYSPGDDDLFFYEWMQNRNDYKDGKIVLSEPKERPTKTIEFSKAYCVGIADSFKALDAKKPTDEQIATTKITISASEITFGHVTFQNNQGVVKDDKFYLSTSNKSTASAASAEVIGAGKISNV